MSIDRGQFLDAYDLAMARWPRGTEISDLTSDFGTTRVYSCGPAEGLPVILLAAYQATSAEWNPLAHDLMPTHRLHAVDVPGDPGRSVADGAAMTTPADLERWLTSVLDGLGLASAHFVGHSYGAWMSLNQALNHPDRVSRLTLLDPTMCFTPMLKGYIMRAMPVMMRPTGERRTGLIRWETRGQPLDEKWMALTALGCDAFGMTSTVPTKIPGAGAMRALKWPTTVVVAGSGRVNHARSLARRAEHRSPAITAHTLPAASHYGMPMTHAADIADLIRSAGSDVDAATPTGS